MTDAAASALGELCDIGASFFARGLAFGSTGNLSVRIDDRIWITPTGGSLRNLAPEGLACLDRAGQPQNDARASKEAPFHLAIYAARSDAAGVVHLHSPHAVMLACLADLAEDRPLPILTPYYVMRVEPLRVVPYLAPGSPQLADAVREAAATANVLLLRNHGVIAIDKTLGAAADRAEELEESARLHFALRGLPTRELTETEIAELRARYGRPASSRQTWSK